MTYVQNNGRTTTAATENPMTEIGTSRTYLSDPPTDRGPLIGVPEDDYRALLARAEKAEAQIVEARNAGLREAAEVPVPDVSRRYCTNDETFYNEGVARKREAILALINAPAPDHITDAGKEE